MAGIIHVLTENRISPPSLVNDSVGLRQQDSFQSLLTNAPTNATMSTSFLSIILHFACNKPQKELSLALTSYFPFKRKAYTESLPLKSAEQLVRSHTERLDILV